MATGNYERIIKEEVESTDDENVTNNSEERFDSHEVIPKKEFELKHIKVEDVIDIVHHDMKSEQCVGPQEVKEGLHCGLCRGGSISPTDYFSPDSFNCQCKNESNAMKDEDIAQDLKPLRFGSDSGNFVFHDQEGTIVAKEEKVFNNNMPSKSYEEELSVEKFLFVKHEMLHKTLENNEISSSEYYFDSVGSTVHDRNEICSKNLTDRTDSENTSTENMLFHCKVCTKSFIQSIDLKIHEKIHSGDRRFQCKTCLKSFIQGSHLKVHEKLHTGEKPFQCKSCTKTFTYRSNLKSHEKIHAGNRPFQCEICSKSFIQGGDLKRHEKVHTGEKTFQCEICSKSFIQGSDLKRHEKIHTGEKPFQCKICLKSFIQGGDLKRHEKIHTGEKPFQCEICSKSFSQRSSLKMHKKIHTSEKPYQCEICFKYFSLKRYLKLHEKIHTGLNTCNR